jgi:hypothetical protein
MQNNLLIVPCYLIHRRIFHTNTFYLTMKYALYHNFRRCYIFLTEYDLFAQSLKMATYVRRNVLK